MVGLPPKVGYGGYFLYYAYEKNSMVYMRIYKVPQTATIPAIFRQTHHCASGPCGDIIAS